MLVIRLAGKWTLKLDRQIGSGSVDLRKPALAGWMDHCWLGYRGLRVGPLKVDRDGNVKHGKGKREKEFHDWHSLSDCGRRKLL